MGIWVNIWGINKMNESINNNKCGFRFREIEEKLGLLAPENYDYLNQSGTYTVEGTDDVKEFKETMRGISKIEEVF